VVNQKSVLRRLQKLDEYLAYLYDLQQYDFDEFVETPIYFGAGERFLHLAIEAVNDIGNHIIADQNLGVVKKYADIPEILLKHGFISQPVCDTWKDMSGFRNVLVHQYADIERKRVYEVLHDGLEFIESLKTVFAKFL